MHLSLQPRLLPSGLWEASQGKPAIVRSHTFFFFFNLRTTAFLSNSQPCEFCFLCPFFFRGFYSGPPSLMGPQTDTSLWNTQRLFPPTVKTRPCGCLSIFGFASFSLFPLLKVGISSLLTLVNPVLVSKVSVLSELGETVKITASLKDGETEVTQLLSDKLMLLISTARALSISPHNLPLPTHRSLELWVSSIACGQLDPQPAVSV